jgi:anaerobic dimethyl sulfoxide reductase subunit B (iron-sulfur subunit)
MNQWGFYYNQTRCIGCKACVLACKAWNDDKKGDLLVNVDNFDPQKGWWEDHNYEVKLNSYDDIKIYIDPTSGMTNYSESKKYYMKEDWRRVSVDEYGSAEIPPMVDVLYLSVACNHCNEPACIKACPMQIIYKEPEYGIVLVDNSNCISCGSCQMACPWKAPQYYDPNYMNFAQTDPKRPKMTKCTLCVDRIREGLKPACVAACMNRALDAGPMEELESQYPEAVESVENFASDEVPKLNVKTGPNIIFKKRERRF